MVFLRALLGIRENSEVVSKAAKGSTSGGLDPAILTALIHFLDEHNELVRLFRTARDKVVADDVPSFRIRLFSVVGAWEYDLLSSETL
ncbi:hypothetical protein Tco_0557821, partial [Tanacetum coccineum]